MDLYQQIFFTTLAVSFGILHSILFLYNKQFKSNLFFAIFLFLYALNIFFDYQASMAGSWEEELIFLRFHRAIMPYNSIFALLFVYFSFNLKIPKHFWLIGAALAITGFFAVLEPVKNFDYVNIAQIVVLVEAVRIFIGVLKNKKYDAWILFSGFMLLFLFSTYDLLLDLNLIGPVSNIVNGYPFGFLCLIISASIYLARDFARANKTILTKEREAKEMEIAQKLLGAEDKRKAKELNDARDIQLSLLPQSITNIKDYNICFDMRPASEVGGDYYDYSISESREISIVIGDATDHGMRAGMMVSIIKSLFLTHVNNTEIKDFLNNCSRTIKQMNLKNLYMALMLLKIKDRHLTVSSAGIPPLLIYRRKMNKIEEYKIKGMPLGALDSFPYETIETELDFGDTVLLMTDGLPELFDKNKQSFGNDKLKEIFIQNANEPVNEIINRLFLAGESWMKDSKQNDDITLVAFRLNEKSKSLQNILSTDSSSR
jgi:serine phosphatase RsbU (regulator of sigma subunit)